MRPYRSRIALLETDALRWTRSCVPIGVVLLCWRRTPFAGHDRVSLYFATRLAVLQRTHRPCVPTGVVLLCWRRMPFAGDNLCVPIFRYLSCCTTTDAPTVRPYRNRIALLETGTLWLDMSRASVQRATRFIGLVVRFAELRSQCWLAHLKKKYLCGKQRSNIQTNR